MAEKNKITELKEKYEEIRKKFKLIPSFEEMDGEFEIREIEKSYFVIPRRICRIMCRRLESIANALEPILNPHQDSMHSAIEIKAFEKKELEEIFQFYKKLWHLIHLGLLESFKSDKNSAEFVNQLWKDWPAIKKQTLGYLEKITKSWTEKDKEEESGYLG